MSTIQRTPMKISMVVFTLLILVVNPAQAQDSLQESSSEIIHTDHPTLKSWLRIGIGATKHRIFLGGNLFFRVAGPVAVGMRAGAALEIDIFAQPGENFWEFTPAIAYSPVRSSRAMIAGIAGLGVVGGTRRGDFLGRQGILVEEYEKITFRTFSAALEIQAAVFIPGAKGLALAASMFTNLNNERSYSGYYFGILFGERR